MIMHESNVTTVTVGTTQAASAWETTHTTYNILSKTNISWICAK
jgi:hypothetical protein